MPPHMWPKVHSKWPHAIFVMHFLLTSWLLEAAAPFCMPTGGLQRVGPRRCLLSFLWLSLHHCHSSIHALHNVDKLPKNVSFQFLRFFMHLNFPAILLLFWFASFAPYNSWLLPKLALTRNLVRSLRSQCCKMRLFADIFKHCGPIPLLHPFKSPWALDFYNARKSRNARQTCRGVALIFLTYSPF